MATLVQRVTALAQAVAADVKALRQGKADDSVVVKLSGDQTVSGTKTFGSPPAVPIGTAGANPVRRDDPRLTDPRAPTAHAHTLRGLSDYDDSVAPTDGQAILWVPSSGRWAPRTVTAGSVGAVSLTATETIGGRKSFNLSPIVPVGELLANPVRRDDSRLTDARAPTAHAGSHASDGADPVTPASIGAEALARRSVVEAKVPNGYIGADGNGNVATNLQYSAGLTTFGIARGTDMAFFAGLTGSRNDRLIYGDELSPYSRDSAVLARTAALNTLYQCATVAAYNDVATRVRVCTRAASAGTGTFNVGVFIGDTPSSLPRVALASAASVPNGIVDLALPSQVSWTAGQWVVITIQMTGFSTIPSLAAINGAAALINGNGFTMGGTRSATSTPTTLSITSGATGDGQIPWWALT